MHVLGLIPILTIIFGTYLLVLGYKATKNRPKHFSLKIKLKRDINLCSIMLAAAIEFLFSFVIVLTMNNLNSFVEKYYKTSPVTLIIGLSIFNWALVMLH